MFLAPAPLQPSYARAGAPKDRTECPECSRVGRGSPLSSLDLVNTWPQKGGKVLDHSSVAPLSILQLSKYAFLTCILITALGQSSVALQMLLDLSRCALATCISHGVSAPACFCRRRLNYPDVLSWPVFYSTCALLWDSGIVARNIKARSTNLYFPVSTQS